MKQGGRSEETSEPGSKSEGSDVRASIAKNTKGGVRQKRSERRKGEELSTLLKSVIICEQRVTGTPHE